MKAEEFNAKNPTLVPLVNTGHNILTVNIDDVYAYADQVAKATVLQCAALICTACRTPEIWGSTAHNPHATIESLRYYHQRMEAPVPLLIPCHAAAIHALIAKDYK